MGLIREIKRKTCAKAKEATRSDECKRIKEEMGSKYLQKKTTGQRGKGLNFALSSHIVPPKDMFATFEGVICHLRGENQDATRAEA